MITACSDWGTMNITVRLGSLITHWSFESLPSGLIRLLNLTNSGQARWILQTMIRYWTVTDHAWSFCDFFADVAHAEQRWPDHDSQWVIHAHHLILSLMFSFHLVPSQTFLTVGIEMYISLSHCKGSDHWIYQESMIRSFCFLFDALSCSPIFLSLFAFYHSRDHIPLCSTLSIWSSPIGPPWTFHESPYSSVAQKHSNRSMKHTSTRMERLSLGAFVSNSELSSPGLRIISFLHFRGGIIPMLGITHEQRRVDGTCPFLYCYRVHVPIKWTCGFCWSRPPRAYCRNGHGSIKYCPSYGTFS